jgi:hypothetical protein
MAKAQSAYSELLKDPRWQRKRLEILQRDNWTCQWCGDKESTLHVHHKDYESGKAPWEYEDSWLMTVCEDCHQVEYESRRVDEQALIHNLRLAGVKALSVNHIAASVPKNLTPKAASHLAYIVGLFMQNQEFQKMVSAFYGLDENGEIKRQGP